MRTGKKVEVKDVSRFKEQLLQWAQQFGEIVWLDSNNYKDKYSGYDAILAVEAFTAIKTDYLNAFDQLLEYQTLTADWIFGYLSYDLKNGTEELTSENFDGLHFPEMYFFQPKKIFLLKGHEVEIQYLRMVDDEMEEDLKVIEKIKGARLEVRENLDKREENKDTIQNYTGVENLELKTENSESKKQIIQSINSQIKSRLSRKTYLEKVNKMLWHIQRGDIYEANFCQEFFVENATLDPLQTFESLNTISNPPFAAFLKLEKHYLFCASPERYLQKQGNKIISQPIKGTARRAENAAEDEQLITDLGNDPKERSENVMIVDLVRNDLSKTGKKGSVEVEELCKIYTFRQVHQMISTVTSQLAEGIPAVEVLRSTFPMGSMTGTPKISALKIIEELEESKRGLYSGAVGYFTPKSDFDFNVVIRSILYNKEAKYASFSVGSAITSRSIPEKEYEECLLKAKAMREVLEKQLEESN
ncbi:para-aminobenzoate synthase [Salinimicrobium marinum]|uniref:Para-aminobenzoate synthase n=1 Tax=Salinimicrobium marinum TaxID=680283 RepID=A0A918VVT7_9FLAO|nr:anthranilate synthase component I family protein [Salinimicrobium marinum]GHA29355.1 para-aminobenzoate synthase [Salinimicrobium marinum]